MAEGFLLVTKENIEQLWFCNSYSFIYSSDIFRESAP